MGRNLIFLGIISIFIWISIVDIKKKIIPNYLTLPLCILSFLINYKEISFENMILGGFVYCGFFSLIYGYGSDLLKKECLGFGDVKLAFALGILLGYRGLLDAVMFVNLTFTTALIAYTLVIIFKRIKVIEFPLGPFLVLGALIKIVNRLFL